MASTLLTRQGLSQREEGGIVGDEAGGEEKRGLLPMERRQFALQLFVERSVAGDVSGSSGARAELVDGLAVVGGGVKGGGGESPGSGTGLA